MPMSYRIKPYNAIVKDPKNTILFDHEGDAAIRDKREALGADGALLSTPTGEVYKVNFIENVGYRDGQTFQLCA